MKKGLFILFLVTFCVSSYSQTIRYNSLRTGSFSINPDSEDNNEMQYFNVWAEFEIEELHDENIRRLNKEVSKTTPDPEEVKRLKKLIEDFEADPDTKESRERNVIGKRELMACSIDYIIDNDNKLKIVGKTESGDLLFEFGMGHNQELILENDDKDEYSIIWIHVYNHDGGGRIAKFEQSDIDCKVYIGDVKRGERTEVISLAFDNIDENRETINENEMNRKQLIKRLLQVFPKDKDGDRWMLCK